MYRTYWPIHIKSITKPTRWHLGQFGTAFYYHFIDILPIQLANDLGGREKKHLTGFLTNGALL